MTRVAVALHRGLCRIGLHYDVVHTSQHGTLTRLDGFRCACCGRKP